MLLLLHYIPLRNAYACLFVSVLAIFIGDILYKLNFHPLHKFKGPFLGVITDFYKTYLFSTRELHLRELVLHKKYGM